nr:MAG TPA: hypothetical protein [Siphoviridae sp. ct6662]
MDNFHFPYLQNYKQFYKYTNICPLSALQT